MLEKEIEFKFGQKYANVKGDDAFKAAKITSIEMKNLMKLMILMR